MYNIYIHCSLKSSSKLDYYRRKFDRFVWASLDDIIKVSVDLVECHVCALHQSVTASGLARRWCSFN